MSETIIEGCVLDVLPLMEAASLHMCATSPPFFGLRNYEIVPSNWPAVRYTPMAGLPKVEVEAWTGCLGHESDPLAYVGHLVTVFRLVRRVLRDDATLWLNLGDSFCGGGGYSPGSPSNSSEAKKARGTGNRAAANITGSIKPGNGLKTKDLIGFPWRVAFALQADGWWLRSEIIWAKGLSFCESYAGSVMPESVTDRPTRSHEQVFLLTKKAKYFYDYEAVKEKAQYTGTQQSQGSEEFNGKTRNQTRPDGRSLASFRAVVEKRNLRSVWTINPEPQKKRPGTSHYASWPSALVAPMIRAGTSEHGVCPACLAPWERVVEKVKGEVASSKGSSFSNGKTAEHQLGRASKQERTAATKTIGWRPTCDCEAGKPVPATVLDIFAGTGTTAAVARRLGRHAILIDRSGEYVVMQRERLAQRELF